MSQDRGEDALASVFAATLVGGGAAGIACGIGLLCGMGISGTIGVTLITGIVTWFVILIVAMKLQK